MPVISSLIQVLLIEVTPWISAAIKIAAIFWLITFYKIRKRRYIPFMNTVGSEVFLSYKSDDAVIVRFLAEQMMARGINVWFNEYRIMLHRWETAFEDGLKAGVGSSQKAAFFTNEKWAKSKWCVDTEAPELLELLTSENCVEVCIPPHPAPHQKVKGLKEVDHRIDATDMDKWELLQELCNALRSPISVAPPAGNHPYPLRGRLNDVPYELNTAGWSIRGDARSSMGNVELPSLIRTDNGTTLSVNIVAGKRGWERKEINDPDDRKVCENLRDLARSYFQRFFLAGECIGVHLVFNSDLSHGAFTYWGKSAWCRKYAIVLPGLSGKADIVFTFTCSVYGSFHEFCRVA
jgi:hypothetical protein